MFVGCGEVEANEHESCWSTPIHTKRKNQNEAIVESREWRRGHHQSLSTGITPRCAWESVKSRYQPLRSHAQPHSATQVSSYHSPGLQVSASSSTWARVMVFVSLSQPLRDISPTGLWVHMQAIGLLYGYKEPIDTDPYDHHLSLVFVSCNLLLPWVAGRLWMP